MGTINNRKLKIKILVFGKIADVTDCYELSREGISTLMELKAALERDFPALKELHYQMAVNKKIELSDIMLTDGCEVALLPPFSGG